MFLAEFGEKPSAALRSAARRRCFRNTDGYAALQVEILANQAELSASLGHAANADALGREWVAIAARAYGHACGAGGGVYCATAGVGQIYGELFCRWISR